MVRKSFLNKRANWGVETRWNSPQDMLDYFVENWMEIVCIVSTLLPRNDKLYRYVEDIHSNKTKKRSA